MASEKKSADKPNPAKDLDAWFEKVFDKNKFTHLTDEMRKNTKSFFASMQSSSSGAVTREEFEAQKKTVVELAKTLAKLEQKLDQLAGKKVAKKAAKKPAKKAARKTATKTKAKKS